MSLPGSPDSTLLDDIPLDLAIRAHAGTSWTPDLRGEQIRTEYVRSMQSTYEQLLALAQQHGTTELLAAEWEDFREGYVTRVHAWLQAHAACLSTMIAGPSNFNWRRAERCNRTSDKRAEEMNTYFARGLKAIRKVLTPEAKPESTVEKLRRAEDRHAYMLTVNRAIRQYAHASEFVQLAKLEELGIRGQSAIDLLHPAWGRPGFDGSSLGNSSAKIRGLKAKLIAETAQGA